jgi:hypothetical protein
VHVEGAGDLIGEIRDVTIVEAQPNSLKGALASAKQREAAQAV